MFTANKPMKTARRMLFSRGHMRPVPDLTHTDQMRSADRQRALRPDYNSVEQRRTRLDLGDHFAGYRLDRVLGRGGMGVVYEATQLTLGRAVALKVVAPAVSDDLTFRERFRREGPLQARSEHPHIVPVFAAGDCEGHLFIAMRLVRGPSLRRLISAGPLEPERALRILTPIADALDVAHEAGLIHRDVKPPNILLERNDHSFLSDFGLTTSSGELSLTQTGQFVGTLNYISPEQLKGEHATRASDVYALAAVLHEALTGRAPYCCRPSEAAVLLAHLTDPPPRPSQARPELGSQIDDVICRGLAKNPEDRPATALELLNLAHEALGTRRSPPPHSHGLVSSGAR